MRHCHTLLRLALCGFIVFTFGLKSIRAADSDPPLRQLGIALSNKDLLASFSFRDAFNKPTMAKLKSGLPTRIVVQINLERRGERKPITYWVRSINIVYDLWEEVFIVTVDDEQGRRHAKAGTAGKAIELACTLSRGRVAHIGGQPLGVYRLRTLIEVNPVSKEMVENIRRWLSRPQAGKSGVEAQTNFFGSFVGIFVDRRIGQADHTIAFVSQWFRLGES
ncbi:MAG: DUF4390 domain-containing protein [Proteobacteria bacterium]|nr:DUF4390 domain-containing protein [Pseudomonadota bacterium]